MAYGIVLEFGKDVTKAQYDAVNEKLAALGAVGVSAPTRVTELEITGFFAP